MFASPFASVSMSTWSPTAIGLVLRVFTPLMRKFPFKRHSARDPSSNETVYQLPVERITKPFFITLQSYAESALTAAGPYSGSRNFLTLVLYEIPAPLVYRRLPY